MTWEDTDNWLYIVNLASSLSMVKCAEIVAKVLTQSLYLERNLEDSL